MFCNMPINYWNNSFYIKNEKLICIILFTLKYKIYKCYI